MIGLVCLKELVLIKLLVWNVMKIFDLKEKKQTIVKT